MNSQRLQQLLSFIADSPDDAFLLFALAKEYEGQGATENAFKYYLQLQQTNPDYVGLYYHLGKLQEKNGQFDDALSTYKQGIAVAQKIGDRHALGELMEAKMNIDDEDDDDEF